MNSLKIALSIFILLCANACVTTRAQLRESRGTTSESGSSVKSEPLSDSQGGDEDDGSDEDTVKAKPAPAHRASNNDSSSGSNSYSFEEIKSEMSKLIGRVDELEQKQTKFADNEEVKKLQSRIDELEKKVNTQPTAPAAAVGTAEGEEFKNYFQIGKEAYGAGNYDEAIQAFDEFLKKPNSKNQEEAIFLKGEAYFKLKNYKKAIVEYSKFPEKYSKSSFHPKALMKIAESFDGLGMKEDAKAFYTDLIEKFPKSAEAKAAKKRIKKK